MYGLPAGIGLSTGTLCNDLDAGQIGIEFLVESGGACLNALQAGHALLALLDGQLFHMYSLLKEIVFG